MTMIFVDLRAMWLDMTVICMDIGHNSDMHEDDSDMHGHNSDMHGLDKAHC